MNYLDIFTTYNSVEAPKSELPEISIPQMEEFQIEDNDNTQDVKPPADFFSQDQINANKPKKEPIKVNYSKINSPIKVQSVPTSKGKERLIQILDNKGITGEKREFLLKSAYLESGYNYSSSAKASSACGYFGFLNGTIKAFSSSTRQQFLSSPELQVDAASRLYDYNKKSAQNSGILQLARNKGYSENEVIAAMWLSPKWTKQYFKNGTIGGSDAFGTSVPKYINKFRSIKV